MTSSDEPAVAVGGTVATDWEEVGESDGCRCRHPSRCLRRCVDA